MGGWLPVTTMAEIPPDHRCLFGLSAHQLFISAENKSCLIPRPMKQQQSLGYHR
jgi:hypothetical protein